MKRVPQLDIILDDGAPSLSDAMSCRCLSLLDHCLNKATAERRRAHDDPADHYLRVSVPSHGARW